MKLYDLRRGTKFRLSEDPTVPPDLMARQLATFDIVYTFGSIDGMYSNSIGEDGERYYFAAWTEVEEVLDE